MYREETMRWEVSGDVQLVGSSFGNPQGQPVLLLHGGGQTRHAWGGTGKTLGEAGYFAVSIDLRGHGESSWASNSDYTMDIFCDDLKRIVANLHSAPAIVGASLGGLTGLVTAGENEESLLAALILVDVAPKMERKGVTRILDFMKGSPDGFATLEEAADAISTFLPHRKRPKDLSGLEKNLRLHDDGRYRWHWDPKFVWRNESDAGFSYERFAAAAKALRIPTLLVRGKQSAVLSNESAQDFKRLAPHSEYVDVADAAHMIAGDKNDIFTNSVLEFLTSRVPLIS